ncbi:hypothetical protein GQ43DRAFT_470502 [Delitschia confertaspora ATCC 74209]|uniref:DUF6594 domain-containing protein n=1 Tax=Delitschia confertaspora ATCC 74209 TaxID=1513339 RepID=A0A9P4JNW1_9PLEO|nr:hypothetical protein GQ43DRAFT_470502 [Delitschia confertaspora ATCC 74209]
MAATLNYQYHPFYDYLAEYPEGIKVRRFIGEWAWILNCEVSNIRELEKKCRIAMAESHGFCSGVSPWNPTDWHPLQMGSNAKLKAIIEELQTAIKEYTRDLLQFEQVMRLPSPSPRHMAKLLEAREFFEGGVFGPTGEDEVRYKELGRDSCAVISLPKEEPVTHIAINIIERLSGHRWSRFLGIPPHVGNTQTLWGLDLQKLDTVVDYTTYILLDVLLTGALFVLGVVQNAKQRIALIGGFYIPFVLLIKATAHPRRVEMFAISAAYFAIASVFATVSGSDKEACH